MRILIAQMTRMGDMLQTSPLIRQLRWQYPEAHITVMLRNMGKAIAAGHPDIDETILYDEDEMFRDLRSRNSDRVLHAYETAESYIKRLREGRFDVVYNCTQSIGSAMLLKLAGIPKVVGAHLSDDWQFVLRGRWTNYFFTSCHHREYSDINLCDVFRNLAEDSPPCRELVFEIEEEERRRGQELLREHGIEPDDFVVCFQLGASENEKRWPGHRFAGLARLLRKRYQAKIVLLGVEGEHIYGDEFAQHQPGPFIPLFGRTNIPQLAAVLERANLLVTNDTGTMHIGAAVKCPIVLVSVGPVHFRETGPYGEGHIAIERLREVITSGELARAEAMNRDHLRPEQVMVAVGIALSEDSDLKQIDLNPELTDAEIQRSAMGRDGFLEWFPVIRRPLALADFSRIAYRLMWLEHLTKGLEESSLQAALREILLCYLPPADPLVEEWGTTVSQPFGELAELAEKGLRSTDALIGLLEGHGRMSEARDLVANLMQLDEAIRVHGEIHPVVRPLAVVARFERENLEGSDPLALARTTRAIYLDLEARASLIQAKVQQLIRVWRKLHG